MATVASTETPPCKPCNRPGMSRSDAVVRSSTRALTVASMAGKQRSDSFPFTKSDASVPMRSARCRSIDPAPRRSTLPAARLEMSPMVRPGTSTLPPRVATLTCRSWPRPWMATLAWGTSTRTPPVFTTTLALRIFTRPSSNRSSTSGRHCPPRGGDAPCWSSESRSSGRSISSRSSRTRCKSGRTLTCAKTRAMCSSMRPPGAPTSRPSMVSLPTAGSTEQRATFTCAAVASSMVATA